MTDFIFIRRSLKTRKTAANPQFAQSMTHWSFIRSTVG